MTVVAKREEVSALFGVRPKQVQITRGKTSVRIHIQGSLLWEGGLLNTLLKLRDLYGGTDVDLPSHYHVNGCETCDYGAYDDWEFLVTGVTDGSD